MGLGILSVLVLAPPAAQAQDEAPLYLSVEPEGGELRIRLGNLLEEGGLTQALHSGLPVRILIVAELWQDGFFDRQRGRGEWRASVVFDPLSERYRVATGVAGAEDVVADSLADVRAALQDGFSLPLRPERDGRFYYLGQVEVETLSLSDLQELQRWLRGDLAPAVAGERDVSNAVGRGVRRMLVRMLGLPSRRFRVRSPTFEIHPPEPG